MKRYLFFLVLIVEVFAGCKKGAILRPTAASPTNVDVYISGYSVAANGEAVASYWKNGILTRLEDSSANSMSTAIAVSPVGDIYTAGYFLGSGAGTANFNQEACYWKNGVISALNTGPNYSGAYSIVFVGNDTYIGGITSEHLLKYATYWKNGNQVQLPLGWSGSDMHAIATNGSDVFFAGDSRLNNTSFTYYPTFWKNNSPAIVLSSTETGQVSAIALNGEDVYMAGYTEDSNGIYAPTYWKNSVETKLATDDSFDPVTTGIAVAGSNVYVTGGISFNGHLTACYWKNKALVHLTDGTFDSSASAITVVGSDVYIGGTAVDQNGHKNACYWKNGVITLLPKSPNGVTAGLGIAVVKR